MKTITYNPETHALVPVEPTRDMVIAGTHQRFRDSCDAEEDCYRAMIAAAPQPEPVDVGSVGWKHDCAALCANDIELWIDRCPHCGKPRHNHPPTDDELLNKAEPVDVEPAMWVMKHIRSGDLAQAKPNQKALHPRMWSQAHLYTTPQPDRTDRVRELEEENARLNSEIEMLKSGKRSNIRLGMEIAASQAYAEQLREALQWAKAGFNQAAMGIIIQRELEENFNLCRDALALPRDTSALDAYVSEKMKEAVSTQKEYYESVFQDGAKRIATLTRQRDLAVEALEKQGHSAGCRKNAFGDICTCGLDDLLSTIKEIEAMAKGEQR